MTCLLTGGRAAIKPALANVRLDYAPAAYLTHSSAAGQRAARQMLSHLADGEADPDILFLTLKGVIGSELQAAVLAELRTFSRLVQRTLEEGAA